MCCFKQLSLCSNLTCEGCGTRSSRSPEQERAGAEQEGKRDLKALHSTFAKAEGETVLPDKTEHLILPPKRVDTAFPDPASERYCHAVYHLVLAKQDLLGTSLSVIPTTTFPSCPPSLEIEFCPSPFFLFFSGTCHATYQEC